MAFYKSLNRKNNNDCFYSFGIATCYILLALVAVVVTYELVDTLIISLRHPVRSISYRKEKEYEAPGLILLVMLQNFLLSLLNEIVANVKNLTTLLAIIAKQVWMACEYESLNGLL